MIGTTKDPTVRSPFPCSLSFKRKIMKLILGPFFFSFEFSVAKWMWDQRGPVANAFSETGACKDLAERVSEEVGFLRPQVWGLGRTSSSRACL